MERTRLMAMVVKDIAPAATGAPVYHFAPEPSLVRVLKEKYSAGYKAADFDPSQYPWYTDGMQQMDLSRSRDFFKPGSVQGFLHAHVLEHVPGDLNRVIREMNDAIAPGGFHIFCIPFFTKWYREDMDPEMSHEMRDRLFGQYDHMRSFGTQDYQERVLSLFDGFERVNLSRHFTRDQLVEAAVPASALTSPTSHTVYFFRKK